MGGSPVTRVSGTRVPTSARDHARGRTRHQSAQEYGIGSRPVMAQGKEGDDAADHGGHHSWEARLEGGRTTPGCLEVQHISPRQNACQGGPPPVASHLGIGMPSQRFVNHEADQGGTPPLVSQTDMKEDHQVTVGSVEHTIQTRRRARGFTTLFRRRKGRRPGGSRGQTTGYVDRCSKGERGGVVTPAGRGAQG